MSEKPLLLYTRCESCESIHPVALHHLTAASGKVRCGDCGGIFNALNQLFETRPGPDTPPLPSGTLPPLLESQAASTEPEPAKEGSSAADRATVKQTGPLQLELDAFGQTPASNPSSGHRLIGLAAVLSLGGLLAYQLISQSQQPDSWLATRLPQAISSGAQGPDPAEVVQVMSTDLHPHPTVPDAIVLALSITNTGQQAIDWPEIEISLFDPSQQVIGTRRLQPGDYLRSEVGLDRGLTPGTIAPILVEVMAPDTQATGFDIRIPGQRPQTRRGH